MQGDYLLQFHYEEKTTTQMVNRPPQSITIKGPEQSEEG